MSNEDKKLRYEFAPASGGDVDGPKGGDVSSFIGSVPYHLARESVQNSIDAVVDKEKPVKMKFSLHQINARDIPNWKKLKEISKNCSKFWSEKPMAKRLFGSIYKKIDNNEKIPLLKISDYNTKGLTGGDYDQEGNYFNFLKSSGSTSKTEGSTAGSYGLGKGAYYNASNFRMIFAISVPNDEHDFVFQGKLRLASWENNEKIMKGNGSFGLPDQRPLRDESRLPNLFSRKEFKRKKTGTDIFVVDFRETEDWEKKMIKSFLSNFWLSIYEKKLVVEVGGKIITKDNLEDFLYDFFGKDSFNNKDNPIPFYKTYTISKESQNAKKFKKSLTHLGKVKLYLYSQEDFPNRILRVRKTGMTIEKKQRRVANSFAGVLRCVDEKGNRLLKKMENPAHNKWDYQYVLYDEEAREKAKESLREIDEFVREKLKSFFKTENRDSLGIKGLDNLVDVKDKGESTILERVKSKFGEKKQEEDSGSKETLEQIPGKEKGGEKNIKTSKRINKVQRRSGKEDEKGRRSLSGKGSRGGSAEKKRTKTGTEDEEGKRIIELKDLSIRSYAQQSDVKVYHIILIKNIELNDLFHLKIHISTEEGREIPNILKAYDCKKDAFYNTKENHILNIDTKEEKVKLKVAFEDNQKYSLRVTPYQYEN